MFISGNKSLRIPIIKKEIGITYSFADKMMR